MTTRRRRRDRRPRQPDHPEPPRAAAKKKDRRRTEFEARMARIARTRSVIGLFGFAPLLAVLGCGMSDLGPICAVPREIYYGLWAAILGTFLGLTIRMWRERRAFDRATVS